MANRSTFVEFSGEPTVKPISVSPTIERHRLTALVNTNLCTPYTATISIEAVTERDARVLFEWFRQQGEAAPARSFVFTRSEANTFTWHARSIGRQPRGRLRLRPWSR